MTIEYKDSKRIVNLSTDVVNTPDINETFETDTKTAQNGTLVAWDSTDKRIEGTMSRINTNTNWIYDLGSDLSTTKFIVDFQFDIISNTNPTGTSATNFFQITSGTGGNQGAGGFSFTFESNGSGGYFGINAKNSGDMESGNTWGSAGTFASNTTYYMRMIRDGDDFTCIRYSDTWGGTVAETLEKTVSGVTGLRYWRIQNYNGATSSYNGVTTFAVDNLKLYNGVTSLTNKPTDVQDNSILVEKNTGNRYWRSESGTTINFPPTTTPREFTTQGTPDDMVFSQDGLHLYTVDGTGALSLGEYTLTTAWDISTASHTRNKSFSYGSLSGVSINNDGTKIYVVDYTTQKCHQLDLSTAYNISTATDNGVWKYVTGGTGYVPTGIHFKPDGTRAYVVDQNPDQLTSYTLSTAWDLSTLSYDSVNKSLSSQNPEGMVMNYTGTKIWVLYNSNDTVQEWTLSTAWDLSTATANATTWDFSAVANTLSGGDTNPDDSTIYFLNSTGKVLEYPPTPATWINEFGISDGLMFGGVSTSTYANFSDSQSWNGVSWTAGGSLTGARQKGASAGTGSTSARYVNGYNSTPAPYPNSNRNESYNGTAWASDTVHPQTVNNKENGGCGTADSMIVTGGHKNGTGDVNNYYKWTGSWTSIAQGITGSGGSISGTLTSALMTKSTSAQTWNGSSWTSSTATSTSRTYAPASGTSSTSGFRVFGTYANPFIKTSESWNGTAWTARGSAPSGRVESGCIPASTDSMMTLGGQQYHGASGSALYSTDVYEYRKGTFTTGASFTDGRRGSGGAGS